MKMAVRNVKMDLEFSQYIPHPPVASKQLHQQACSNDEVTINSWRSQWIEQAQKNHKKYGPFANLNVGSLYGTHEGGSVIVAGAGPSLGVNIDVLAEASHSTPVISVLHNFHYMVDHGVNVDYFVSLDAGDVTIPEISEGGSHNHEYYLDATKDKTLIAFIGSHPKLLDSWKGNILFMNAPIPDQEVTDAYDALEPFNNFVGNGGNVLGACVYIAKMMGALTVAYVGADFSFSYDKRFHPWPSKYDYKLGNSYRIVDIFGHSVHTWGSYHNFKSWFEYVACEVPGIWINCSEGGCLGAYPQGNIQQIQQMSLSYFKNAYNVHKAVEWQMQNPSGGIDKEKGNHVLLF
jgi:hypothetical protein